MKYLLIYYGIISVVLLVLMASDKYAAIKDWRRVPESRLFILALIGGGFGGLLGMLLCHHKVRKPMFWLINIGSILLHIALIFAVWTVFYAK